MEEQTGQRRTVVIAMDASPNARKAFQWYVDNLHRPGDHAVLVTVVHIMEAFTAAQWRNLMLSYDSDVTAVNVDKQRHALERQSQELEVMMKDAKVQGTVKWVHGASPSNGILAMADDCNASCVISGSRGLGTFQRGILGSTSEQLLQNSNITIDVASMSGSAKITTDELSILLTGYRNVAMEKHKLDVDDITMTDDQMYNLTGLRRDQIFDH